MAAENIARGKYSPLPPAKSQDEGGQLISNFNTMVSQLQERMRLKKDLGLAMEVQQSLLPRNPPEIEGFDIAGKSIYCDQTGGDYFDFIAMPDDNLGVVVGDVSGHGIGAALLMAETRAYLRSFAMREPDVGQILASTNRALSPDLNGSQFVTLLFVRIDPHRCSLVYSSAGHLPGYLLNRSGGIVNRSSQLRSGVSCRKRINRYRWGDLIQVV